MRKRSADCLYGPGGPGLVNCVPEEQRQLFSILEFYCVDNSPIREAFDLNVPCLAQAAAEPENSICIQVQ